jgi:hypothetical protein
MKPGDVIVLHVANEVDGGDEFLIGRVVGPENPDLGNLFPTTFSEEDRDRAIAFSKARAMADGNDVFFTQRGRSVLLQDFYNYPTCQKCGLRMGLYDESPAAQGGTIRNCPECGHVIDLPPII